MDLSIIIVSYNTKELLKKCLASLLDQPHKVKLEIIVVDNNSGDGSQDEIKKQGLIIKKGEVEYRYLLNDENLGFAKANNQALRIARGKFSLLLNSDTKAGRGALEKLVEFSRQAERPGIVGARLLNPDGTVQPSVYHLPTILGAIKEYWLGEKGAFEKYVPYGEKAVEVEAVVGAAMLIPREVMERIGYLDEGYFMYFEDLDYCRRARQANLAVYYCPEAEVSHDHGSSPSSGKSNQYLVASSKRYHGLVRFAAITFILWSGQKISRFFGKK